MDVAAVPQCRIFMHQSSTPVAPLLPRLSIVLNHQEPVTSITPLLPRLSDHQEPVTWLEVYDYLMASGGIKAVSPSEARAKASKGG